MVFNFFPNIKKGVTLIEIVVVIAIIIMFAMILTANFPKILRQSALSRATYKLAQDLRKVEDLGFSGITTNDGQIPTAKPIAVKGYGVSISTGAPPKYIIYADVLNDQKYVGNSATLCSTLTSPPVTVDCVVDIIDLTKENPSLSIESLVGGVSGGGPVSGSSFSINFSPPNPNVRITDSLGNSYNDIIITFKNTDGSKKTVKINTSGLIYVQ